MKKTAFRIACISSVLVFSATLVHAGEKKIVFNTENIKYEEGTGSERCRDTCSRRSGPDVKSMLSEGWKIVGSSPRKVIGEQYWYAPCNNCKPHGCICIGTEYIVQKDEPAPKIEAKSNAFEVRDKDSRTVIDQPNVGTSKDEQLDLLKKEYDTLKQEYESLRQEIETLRNQLRSKQK